VKNVWVLGLLLLTGGCLYIPPHSALKNSSTVAKHSAEAASRAVPSSSDRTSELSPLQIRLSPFLASVPLSSPETEVSSEDGNKTSGLLSDECQTTGFEGLADDWVGNDPETLEDNKLLSGKDEKPPANEGVTVAAKEVTFDFPVVKNDKVKYFVKFYSGPGHRTFRRWLERSGRFLPMMRRIFAKEGLPKDLSYLALIESGFNDRAYSWANAAGLWQFIPGTGKLYGLDDTWWRDERRDPEKATWAAAKHLKDLYRMFNGNWYLAVAAYNAGPGKIQRAIRRYHTRDFWKLSRGSFLKGETKNYVPKLLAAMLIAKEPAKYGFTDLDYQDPLDYDVVKLPTSTDLQIVANLTNASYERIKNLNPELKRWCTPPRVKNYPLRIPAGTAADFRKKYARIPARKRANYMRHKIRRGDTLLALAHRYHIRVRDIISLNDIRNPRILHIGTNLILPLHAGHSRRPIEELGDDYDHSHRLTYRVRKGDSLWKIARRFSVSEKQLRVWNRLGWSNLLHPGQTLIVSSHGHRRRLARRRKRHHLHKIVYRVRSGDTLWGIGQHFDVAARQIRSWNDLSSDDVLQPGDHLTLMVREGDRG
jgi:membrane-bound lytic murein transglycosylase D